MLTGAHKYLIAACNSGMSGVRTCDATPWISLPNPVLLGQLHEPPSHGYILLFTTVKKKEETHATIALVQPQSLLPAVASYATL